MIDSSYLAKQSHRILDSMIRSGGVIRESKLPMDALVMFKLTNQAWIRPIDEMETGEMVYAITEAGRKEYEKQAPRMSH